MELVYPEAWLNERPSNPAKAEEHRTNREMASANFIAHVRRSRLQPLHGNLGQTAACLRHSFSDARLRKIKASGLPVMVVTGTWDNLVRPEYSYHMKQILNPRFEVFEGSGHAIPEEQPERYNQLLDEHFTSAALASNASPAKL